MGTHHTHGRLPHERQTPTATPTPERHPGRFYVLGEWITRAEYAQLAAQALLEQGRDLPDWIKQELMRPR